MSFKRILFVCTLFTMAGIIWIFYPVKPIINYAEKISELRNNLQVIKSIEFSDTDFDDLGFLIPLLENKRIILLGEQTHYDGSPFKAKARLIKFLHERMGFNVVLYEAGLYDMWKMITTANKNTLLCPSQGLYDFWWNNKETSELWEYYQQQINNDNPITLAGFDIQFTGYIPDSVRVNLLEQYLKKKNIRFTDFTFFSNALKNSRHYFYWSHPAIAIEEKNGVLADIDSLVVQLKIKPMGNFEDTLYIRYLQGIRTYLDYNWKFRPGSNGRMHIRDSMMAGNLIWLTENHFSNQKIIVWAANIHVFYNNDNSYPIQFTPMGEYIKEYYGDTCYSICFSSYADLNMQCSLNNKSNNQSIEYLLHEIPVRYAFLDFESLDTNSFLSKPIMLNVNQKFSLSSNWSEKIGGLFYIDTLYPPTPMK